MFWFVLSLYTFLRFFVAESTRCCYDMETAQVMGNVYNIENYVFYHSCNYMKGSKFDLWSDVVKMNQESE
jgi:hypothetical protein